MAKANAAQAQATPLVDTSQELEEDEGYESNTSKRSATPVGSAAMGAFRFLDLEYPLLTHGVKKTPHDERTSGREGSKT